MAKKNLSCQAIAYHEAGHAVAAIHHQVRITKATIKGTVDLKGYVDHHNPLHGAHPDAETPRRTRSRIENLVAVCYAGPIAERRFNVRTYRHFHAQSDYERAANLAGYLVGSDKELEAYLKWLWVRTENFVEQEWWEQIQTVAELLLDRETVNGASIRELVSSGL
jgi:hypothetical protein